MAYTRNSRLSENNVQLVFHVSPEMMIGKTVVTYIHTKDKKIVFPIAILFNSLKKSCGSFGAEYKKVSNAEKEIASQCCLILKKKIIDPASPMKYKNKCQPLCCCVHCMRCDDANETGVRYQ